MPIHGEGASEVIHACKNSGSTSLLCLWDTLTTRSMLFQLITSKLGGGVALGMTSLRASGGFHIVGAVWSRLGR